MLHDPQYWQARTPRRVRVLGLLFVAMVLAMLGLLWHHWGQNLWLYSAIAGVIFALAIYLLRGSAPQTLCFDALRGDFILLDNENTLTRIQIVRVWQSAFAITLQVHMTASYDIKQLTFWRGTLSASCWRRLHIYLWRYQLQYQLADLKGTE